MWGNAVEWTAAGGTLLAVGFAAYAARTANRQLQVLQRETKERESDSLRRQARMIYFVTTFTEGGPLGVQVSLVNVSQEPVLDIEVVVSSPSHQWRLYQGPLMPTGPEGMSLPSVDEQLKGVLDKYAMRGFKYPDGRRAMFGASVFRIDLIFTDSAGHRWHRARDLTLTAIEASADVRVPEFEIDDGIELMPRDIKAVDWVQGIEPDPHDSVEA